MEFSVSAHGPTPLVFRPVVGLPRRRLLLVSLNKNHWDPCNRQLHRRRHSVVRSSLSNGSRDDETGEDGTNWSGFLYSASRGSRRFLNSFCDRLKKEIGFDVDRVLSQMESLTVGVGEALSRGEAQLDKLRFDLFPRFLDWNEWENWKETILTNITGKHSWLRLPPLLSEDPLPKNDKLRYEPLVIHPAPLHRC